MTEYVKVNVEITQAAETFIRRMMRFVKGPDAVFRMLVKPGGCLGYAVTFDLLEAPGEEDYVWEQSGLRISSDYATSQLLSSIITFGPQPNKAIVGRNAFAHEAGIHQDGYLKEKTTYEIVDPKSVGVPEGRLVLGKHSGRHALKQRCEDLGYHLSKEELETVYHEFTALADRKKGIIDEEIAVIIEHAQSAVAQVAGV